GYYVVPESFKVFVKVDIEEAARRAFNDQNRKDTENFNTLEEQKKDLITRRNVERERYLKTYNIDIDDLSQFDLIVDTTNISAEEATNIIIEEYQKRS
ncbi:MAG: (d)CMP kinase, partial [Clostridium sp.]|nr:(d)CMP kinase [Clostridium sp.]